MPISLTQLFFAEPTPQARRLLWQVLSVGKVWRDEAECHAGADKAGLHLFWVERGGGWLEVPEAKHPIGTGPCCWLVDLAAAQLSPGGWRAAGDGGISVSRAGAGSVAGDAR